MLRISRSRGGAITGWSRCVRVSALEEAASGGLADDLDSPRVGRDESFRGVLEWIHVELGGNADAIDCNNHGEAESEENSLRTRFETNRMGLISWDAELEGGSQPHVLKENVLTRCISYNNKHCTYIINRANALKRRLLRHRRQGTHARPHSRACSSRSADSQCASIQLSTEHMCSTQSNKDATKTKDRLSRSFMGGWVPQNEVKPVAPKRTVTAAQ